jgi:hypothetical protein
MTPHTQKRFIFIQKYRRDWILYIQEVVLEMKYQFFTIRFMLDNRCPWG